MSCLTPERKRGENSQAPTVREEMLSRVPSGRSGAELGTELSFLLSLGLATALTIFIREKAL